MRKVSIIIPKKKSKKVKKLVKEEEFTKSLKLSAGKKFDKHEVVLTELQSDKFINVIKNELDIRIGKPSSEGYVTVEDVDLVAPYIYDQGTIVELDELILTNAKRFTDINKNYIIFIISAALLACLGFQLDNLPVIIGAMLIAPLMTPLMSVSYGLAEGKEVIIKKGLNSEVIGILLIILVSVLMGFFPNKDLTLETTLAGDNWMLSSLVALIIGVVAAISFLTGEFEAQTGVAISISLIPPLTNAVLLLMNGRVDLGSNSLIIFLTNLTLLHLSAAFSFFTVLYKKSQKEEK